jgi:hypothetical protein
MAEKALLRGPIGGLKVLEPKDVLEILKLALK